MSQRRRYCYGYMDRTSRKIKKDNLVSRQRSDSSSSAGSNLHQSFFQKERNLPFLHKYTRCLRERDSYATEYFATRKSVNEFGLCCPSYREQMSKDDIQVAKFWPSLPCSTSALFEISTLEYI